MREMEGEAPSEPVSSEYASRRRPVHVPISPTGRCVIAFITACTDKRQPWLATDACHDVLTNVWLNSKAWLVGRYVILPDHLHLFASPGDLDVPLENWVKYWKWQFTWVHQKPEHRWQAGHWDRFLRLGESYEQKWEYVRNNPVRHGLVECPDDWPFQGELYDLRLD
jgi:putative transposase